MSQRRWVGTAFVIYPEITLPDPRSISLDSQLDSSYLSFNRFWRSSPNYLGDGVPKIENESFDIEGYSDSVKAKSTSSSSNKKGSFYDFLLLRPDNFPKELLGDTPRERPVKRAKWSQDADLHKLDVFEKLEAQFLKAQGKEQKEEGEDDEEVVEEESQGEEDDNGDYNHNQDFDDDDDGDDDDDDYNQADGGGFEDLL
ncbi:hypothetical protein CARUB_v10015904mg [Capsella rubella]|uniref:DNA-directed RNA polymerase III subunit n=1 Tax=Capsella rubella TaxID=81985 RepID=R0I3T5_9BRAS|nr:ribosomal L1 domain-containing protein CG13096 [Capsella rubella]EOA32610.1 hypothetical protein CARUB_v10015904mg [Capsella rubella]